MDNIITSINIIDALSDQITAILDLLTMAGSRIDIQSVNTAAEMCMTMYTELMGEVDKLGMYVREIEKDKIEEVETNE